MPVTWFATLIYLANEFRRLPTDERRGLLGAEEGAQPLFAAR
jgi:hypothetical protein